MQPILKIDLSSGKREEFIVPKKWVCEFVGGASLAARILYSKLTKDLNPFSPEAPLLIVTGPLTGTIGPAVGRFVVCGKSPATGLWAESNCGGFWGPELRFCGYDGLWIIGKAEKPTYLWLNNDKLEFRDATGVWGNDIYSSQEIIRAEINEPSSHILTIGPAGENGVFFAGLYVDHGRAAGRTGLGAVAGEKRLKAIAVRGTGKIPLADAGQFSKHRTAANLLLKEDNIAQVTHAVGTAGVADYADYIGSMPKKYYHQGVLDNIDKISGSTMAETILRGYKACHGCVIACGRVVELGDHIKRKGPEYETVVGFGPNILNTNLEKIVQLNEICDRYGMDTISASNTIGLAYHLFEMGVLDDTKVGFALRWGDTSGAERLLHLIAKKEGIGELMAKGSRRFAAYFGSESEAVQVNGLEVAYHDPRGVSGMALVYATSPRGACHNKSDYFFVDWGQAEQNLGLDLFDLRAGAEKAANVAHHQNWRSLCDSLVMCLFSNLPIDMVSDLIYSANGFKLTQKELLECGERGWNIKRAINNRMGLTSENDTLPKALLTPLEDGPTKDYVPPLGEMLSVYYACREWDAQSGKPKKEKLTALGLDDVVKDLWDVV